MGKRFLAFARRGGFLVVFGLLVPVSAAPAQARVAWTAYHDSPAGGADWVEAIAVDASGNVIVTGSSGQVLPFAELDFITIKYDSGGNRLWAVDNNPHVDRNDYAWHIALGNDGIYVAGSTDTGYRTFSSTIVKYDLGGKLLWEAEQGGADEAGCFGGISMAADAAGSLFVTGAAGPGGEVPWVFATLKYDSNGNLLWTATYGPEAGGDDVPRGIAVDAAGNAYVTGTVQDGESDVSYATVKYDPAGNPLWTEKFLDGAPYTTVAVAADSQGNAYVAGTAWSETTGNDLVTIKYASVPSSFVRGDCNGDGDIRGSVTDAIFLLQFNFLGGPVPGCLSACDVNGDGEVLGQVTDAVYLLIYNFVGGPPPPAPYPECGQAAEDVLGCGSYPGC